MAVQKNQRGRFTVPEELYRDDPECIAEALSQMRFVPVRCEYLYEHSHFEYVGISERFDSVPGGCMSPEYSVVIARDGDGKVSSVDVQPVGT